jgi:hypothetical protein
MAKKKQLTQRDWWRRVIDYLREPHARNRPVCENYARVYKIFPDWFEYPDWAHRPSWQLADRLEKHMRETEGTNDG